MYIYKHETYYENGSHAHTRFYQSPELAVCIALIDVRQYAYDMNKLEYTELNSVKEIGHKWAVRDEVAGRVIYTVKVTRVRMNELDPTDYAYPQDLIKLAEELSKPLRAI